MMKNPLNILFGLILIGIFSIPLGNFQIDGEIPQYELSENDIEWCHEVFPQYETLGIEWFLKNYHHSIEARVCASLYEDELWQYQGEDRMQKLLERSKYYVELEISESKAEAETGFSDPTPASQSVVIPEWIKDVTQFWITDQIDDSGFVQVIEYLVQKEIISIPYAEAPEDDKEQAIGIPIWIKTTAEFWVDNKISNDEFAMGLEWLINNGIIKV